MIGINKCLSVRVCLLLTWLQSSQKVFEAYIWDGKKKHIFREAYIFENFLKDIFEIEKNSKLDFRWNWKFYWDLSNVISDGYWLIWWGCFFRVGLCTLLQAMYVLQGGIMKDVKWRHPFFARTHECQVKETSGMLKKLTKFLKKPSRVWEKDQT